MVIGKQVLQAIRQKVHQLIAVKQNLYKQFLLFIKFSYQYPKTYLFFLCNLIFFVVIAKSSQVYIVQQNLQFTQTNIKYEREQNLNILIQGKQIIFDVLYMSIDKLNKHSFLQGCCNFCNKQFPIFMRKNLILNFVKILPNFLKQFWIQIQLHETFQFLIFYFSKIKKGQGEPQNFYINLNMRSSKPKFINIQTNFQYL
eukprot:TRINITY_DN4267_c0_g1_i8.p2 TRINITY_DN4267_c0_g1~~TRINITY_DN4267_c0_g1_i8.p2  ORF type:complete len:199 (+),score=-11.33 TRINITY_DN4267_c0_g1_i8:186-782(+)